MENVFLISNIAQLKELGKIDVAIIIERTPFFNLIKPDFLVFCLEDHVSFLEGDNRTLIQYIIRYIKTIKVTTQEELDTSVLRYLKSCHIHEKYYRLPYETKESLDLFECGYPSDILEVYAYHTKSIVYLEKYNNTIIITNKPTPMRLYLSRPIFNKSFKVDYKYTDNLLSIIDQTGLFYFDGPHKDWKMVPQREIIDALISIVRDLVLSHPKKIAKYYDLKDNKNIIWRNTECMLYKKHVLTGGRDVRINPVVNCGYISGKSYGVELMTLFNSIGIYPETTWVRAMDILANKDLKPFLNLINRRLSKPLSKVDGKRRLLYELEKFIKPDLVSIVLYGYNRYDLSNILPRIGLFSKVYNKIRSSHLDDKQFVFVSCIFNGGNMMSNYQEWLEKIYKIFPQEKIIDKISKHMVSREKLLPLSAKNIQQIIATNC
jgi:hypothetical protein